MKYKNQNLAFLIEILVGLGTILSVSLLGYKGLAGLSLLAIRPFVLEREKILDKGYFLFQYKVLSNTIIITTLFLLVLLIIIYLFPKLSPNIPTSEKILVQLIPFFLLTHGVIGIMYRQTKK